MLQPKQTRQPGLMMCNASGAVVPRDQVRSACLQRNTTEGCPVQPPLLAGNGPASGDDNNSAAPSGSKQRGLDWASPGTITLQATRSSRVPDDHCTRGIAHLQRRLSRLLRLQHSCSTTLFPIILMGGGGGGGSFCQDLWLMVLGTLAACRCLARTRALPTAVGRPKFPGTLKISHDDIARLWAGQCSACKGALAQF